MKCRESVPWTPELEAKKNAEREMLKEILFSHRNRNHLPDAGWSLKYFGLLKGVFAAKFCRLATLAKFIPLRSCLKML